MKTCIRKQINEMLAKEHACYVLITCTEASIDGQMHVEMTYEGDSTLAAYLLQSAQSFIDDEDEEGKENQNQEVDEKNDEEGGLPFGREFRRMD